MEKLYSTKAIHDSRRNDEVSIEHGITVTVTPPLDPAEGSNPEQLLGLAWAKCLNATTQALLKARGVTAESHVEVTVDLLKEKTAFSFAAHATLAVEGFTLEDTEKLLHQAHERCPVSKLIHANELVTVEALMYTA